MADGATHHAVVALHSEKAHATAREDAVVGGHMLVVAHLHSLDVDVEAIGVLHDELASPQDPALGTRLVALLGLDVVPKLRQLLIRPHLARRQPGDHLFVGHREGHVGALAVLEAEELLAHLVPAPRLTPDLRRVDDRHEQLLAADGVHLVADDAGDLLHHAPAGGQEHIHAGRELAHQAGAHHELVADGLGPGRILLDRGQQHLAEAHKTPRDLGDYRA